MQHYGKPGMLTGKTILFFIVLIIVAFLPVSSFLFFLKNDAFSGYFPPKFFMSESLHDGILPLWNPYINFGLPQYGDMSSGYWSPVTWLIAGTVGYNAYSFTIEVLLYLFIAGIGMYALCRLYKLQRIVCIISGASYMCSGYMVGHMQHFNWISGAAFLPCCLWAYKKLLQDFTVQNVIIAALIFYLLIASAHPGITIGAIYFFTAYAIFELFSGEQKTGFKKITSFLKTNFVFVLGLLVLSSGLIMGYSDILPHFSRAEKPAMEAIMNPSNSKSWISLLFPMATTKNDAWFATDVSMRNLYVGLTSFVFLVLTLLSKKNKEQDFLISVGMFFLLVASGGWVTNILYKLPLLGYVRLPGEYIIFTLFVIILLSAFSIQQFLQKTIGKNIPSLLIALGIYLLCTVCWAIVKIIVTHESILFNLATVNEAGNYTAKLKLLIDGIRFYDAFLIQASIQFILLVCIYRALARGMYLRLVIIIAADLIIASLLNLPFTAVGQASVKNVQQVLDTSPRGIPMPLLQPITLNDTGTLAKTSLVGNWSFYNKQPGVSTLVPYPIELNTANQIFSPANKNSFLKPIVFSTKATAVVAIKKFTGQQINLDVVATDKDTLVWQQSNYPHWKVYVDDKPAQMLAYRGVYMATLISPGHHKVDFQFKPVKVKTTMIISAAAITLSVIYLLLIWIFPSWQQKRLHP